MKPPAVSSGATHSLTSIPEGDGENGSGEGAEQPVQLGGPHRRVSVQQGGGGAEGSGGGLRRLLNQAGGSHGRKTPGTPLRPAEHHPESGTAPRNIVRVRPHFLYSYAAGMSDTYTTKHTDRGLHGHHGHHHPHRHEPPKHQGHGHHHKHHDHTHSSHSSHSSHGHERHEGEEGGSSSSTTTITTTTTTTTTTETSTSSPSPSPAPSPAPTPAPAPAPAPPASGAGQRRHHLLRLLGQPPFDTDVNSPMAGLAGFPPGMQAKPKTDK